MNTEPSLREAVDSGSPALVEAVLQDEVLWYQRRSELLEMRDLARHWHTTGAEAELRRRTGAEGAVARTRVQDGEFHYVDELSLGGLTVRDGHAAILTYLEPKLCIRTSFEELMERALAHPDQEHAVWAQSTILLAHRRDQETWKAAVALRGHADPIHRLFGAEVARLTHLFDGSEEDPFAGPALELFVDWSSQENDVGVLTQVLAGVSEHGDPRADAALLPYAGHPDVRIRRAVASGFNRWVPAFSAAAREALLAHMTDPDSMVRELACRTVADAKDRDPALADAMAALLGDAEPEVRGAAVYGLARHDDERCVAGARDLRPVPPGSALEHYLDQVWRYEMRRDGR
ncbi:HEAT repeat domain-containing protein [Streptomyces olivochromogenes]|uniref:HEAT repeat domain-containing protein n=1 Tax=Streptomyces olivochromogenes TaxID=1963 RepID=UPI001F417BF0|nr:HEAT repeat domain-containing protein [Streptomyces olivochromogenes]MCF3136107.1 HEAT repeat domain-containing protein [Streptomyces olivochromogenes]